MSSPNIDHKTVSSFGDEWNRFSQRELSCSEAEKIFSDYFSIFPWHRLHPGSVGFDMGCGSGRWARLVAPRVGKLHCIDPSNAISVARESLKSFPNIQFHHASLDTVTIPKESQDFGYSLGVLHHVPDTLQALKSCVSLLKPGAPFLIYLYYAFDNRPIWYTWIWRVSNMLRLVLYRLPSNPKALISEIIALLVYLPLARLALIVERFGLSPSNIPLSYYRDSSFYTMRTDARDRFGTPLESRFTKQQISAMCKEAGLVNLVFSTKAPFWCVVGYKSAT